MARELEEEWAAGDGAPLDLGARTEELHRRALQELEPELCRAVQDCLSPTGELPGVSARLVAQAAPPPRYGQLAFPGLVLQRSPEQRVASIGRLLTGLVDFPCTLLPAERAAISLFAREIGAAWLSADWGTGGDLNSGPWYPRPIRAVRG